MAATAAAFAINDASAATLCQSYDVEKALEEKIIVASDATFGKGQAFDPIIKFNIKIKGTTSVVPGVGASGLAAVTGGKTIIDSVKSLQKGDDYPDADISGTNYSGAS